MLLDVAFSVHFKECGHNVARSGDSQRRISVKTPPVLIETRPPFQSKPYQIQLGLVKCYAERM